MPARAADSTQRNGHNSGNRNSPGCGDAEDQSSAPVLLARHCWHVGLRVPAASGAAPCDRLGLFMLLRSATSDSRAQCGRYSRSGLQS